MNHTPHNVSPGGMLILFLVVINTVILKTGFTEDPSWYRVLYITIPLLFITIIDSIQKEALMKQTNKQLILREDDYQLLLSYVNGWQGNTAADRKNAIDLQSELKKAKLVSKDEFPVDVVRLNSSVKVKAIDKDTILELVLVTPDKADIRNGRISVMAPVGTALIGFRKGAEVKWDVPAGKKTFRILEVINQM